MLRVMRLSHSAKRFWASDRGDKNDRLSQVMGTGPELNLDRERLFSETWQRFQCGLIELPT